MDSNFWLTQKHNPFRIVNNSGTPAVAFTRRRVSKKQSIRINKLSDMDLTSASWQALSPAEQADWSAIGAEEEMTGYQAFMQRMEVISTTGQSRLGDLGFGEAYNGGGSLTDNLSTEPLANYKQMSVTLAAGSGLVQLVQDHPENYRLRKRIERSKRTFGFFDIEESVILPLEFGVSWRTEDLTYGLDGEIELVLSLVYDDSGTPETLTSRFEVADTGTWTRQTATISTAPGPILGYSLFINFYNVSGNCFFDNFILKHSNVNWAIDYQCNDVNPVIPTEWGDIQKPWSVASGADRVTFKSEIIPIIPLE